MLYKLAFRINSKRFTFLSLLSWNLNISKKYRCVQRVEICALYSDVSEIYHVRENANTNDKKWNGTMREPRGVSFLRGTVYFPAYAQRYVIQRGVHLLLFRSPPCNLLLKRPVVMSVRNVALSYATHGCRCRVARKIFSGISGRKRNADELALWYRRSRKKASSILHTIIRIPTAGQCVQSVLIHRDSAAIISPRQGNRESQRAFWKIRRHVHGIVLSDSPFPPFIYSLSVPLELDDFMLVRAQWSW